MNEPKRRPAPLVEDETMEGGIDEDGQAVIRPKPVDPRLVETERFTPTDRREEARSR
jgi:hypothetical protein